MLLALHGHDDDPARFAAQVAPLADALGHRLLAPPGPIATTDGRAWFASPGDPPGPPLTDTLDALEAEVEAQAGTDDVVVVLGWSQGAATALALVLRAGARGRPRTLVALAPWLPNEPGVDWDVARAARNHVAVVLVHGTDDEVVDARQGRSVQRVLERAGVDVTWVEVPAGHDLAALLTALSEHLGD